MITVLTFDNIILSDRLPSLRYGRSAHPRHPTPALLLLHHSPGRRVPPPCPRMPRSAPVTRPLLVSFLRLLRVIRISLSFDYFFSFSSAPHQPATYLFPLFSLLCPSFLDSSPHRSRAHLCPLPLLPRARAALPLSFLSTKPK